MTSELLLRSIVQSKTKKIDKKFFLLARDGDWVWARGYYAYGLPAHRRSRPCHRPPPCPSSTWRARKPALEKFSMIKNWYGLPPLDLTQERRAGAETWLLSATHVGYPTITIWGPGALGRPRAHKELSVELNWTGGPHFCFSRRGLRGADDWWLR